MLCLRYTGFTEYEGVGIKIAAFLLVLKVTDLRRHTELGCSECRYHVSTSNVYRFWLYVSVFMYLGGLIQGGECVSVHLSLLTGCSVAVLVIYDDISTHVGLLLRQS